MIIGISKIRPNYAEWLRSEDPAVEVVDLSSTPSPVDALRHCDALLLTGGDDVHPSRYGMDADIALCEEIDAARDELELALIAEARELSLPILGICRGEQIINVALGGTLFADIYTQNGIEARHTRDTATKIDARHGVEVTPGSILHKIVRTTGGEINSAHHQAVRTVAPELEITARAPDGTVEAIEWKEPGGKPFMLAVQWHPERMERDNPFAINILRHFLFEAAAHSALKEQV